MLRALVIAWAVSIGYYALRVTVWTVPDGCPDTVWEPSEDPRCDWSYGDVAWLVSVPVLALTTLAVLIVLGVQRTKSRHAPR